MSPLAQNLFRLFVVASLLVLVVRACHAQPLPAVQVANANCSLRWSFSQLYVRELTGHNDGKEVEAYQRITGNHRGESWCGSFQAAVQRACGLPIPNAAGGARNWFKDPKRTYSPQNATLVRIGHKAAFWSASLGRIGHIGLVVKESRPIRKGRPARGYRIRAGNTGRGGGREGAGVHDYDYPATEIYLFANWLY